MVGFPMKDKKRYGYLSYLPFIRVDLPIVFGIPFNASQFPATLALLKESIPQT